MGSNTPPRGSAESDAEGSNPMDPASMDASSVRISPNMFSVTMTSKSRGLCKRCMAAESTSMCSTVTSGNSTGMMRLTVARQSREVSSTSALSTEINAAREFAHHHDVHAAQQFGFDRRGIEYRRVGHHGPQIGEQPQRLAQLQQTLFRTN